MNKYIRAAICIPFGIIKMTLIKLLHPFTTSVPFISLISPFTEITIERGGKLIIGDKFKMRDGAKIRVRKGALCIIEKNTSINCNNIIACRERIEIGNNVMMSPNVQIYDHDHDFRVIGGIKVGKYKTAPVKIGNNAWIGANTVILKGTTIGENTIIGAGSILKGTIPPNSIIIQKKETEIRKIHLDF